MLALCVLGAVMGAAKPPALEFGPDGVFRIVQFADMHFGEGEAEGWGAVQDRKSLATMRNVVDAQRRAGAPVHLAVLSGDQITGLNVKDNATAYWDLITGELARAALPHTAILGNHDAEPYAAHGGSNQSAPGAKTNRTALMQHDAAGALSHSELGPPSLRPAVSVYVVDVYAHGCGGKRAAAPQCAAPLLQLVHLDSGGGGMKEIVYPPQIAWLNATLAARRRAFGAAVPALVFVHIPLAEFADAARDTGACFGDHDDGIAPTVVNTGLFEALHAHREVRAVFVGHNHCNDFCCAYGAGGRKVDLCFARHSGAGGYNCPDYPIGARVIEAEAAATLKLRTYVRLHNATVIHAGPL